MNNIDKLYKMILESNYIVAFTGAGISTDSGLKDFRSENGLYKEKYDFPAEYMLSSKCFYKDTELFYKYYKDNFNCQNIKPNDAHKLLKKLEDIGKLKAIITQNIDGLHSKAGNHNICEIHGTIYQNHCIKCGKIYSAKEVFKSANVPKCTCGGIIKPNVVLYGESLPDKEYMNGLYHISKADMLIVEGSSLTVYPASSMIEVFNGKYLVIINKDMTPYDNRADLVINENLSSVSRKIMEKINDEGDC